MSMRRFFLERTVDATGVSGTGTVAQGVVINGGHGRVKVVLSWMTEHTSVAVYDSLEALEAIHLHGGATKIRWEDPICFACGCDPFFDEIVAKHCHGCGAGQGDTPYFGARPDPSLGRWTAAITINAPEAEDA